MMNKSRVILGDCTFEDISVMGQFVFAENDP
jgi:hypothetical protein